MITRLTTTRDHDTLLEMQFRLRDKHFSGFGDHLGCTNQADAVATMQLFVEGEVERFSATRSAEVASKLTELNQLRDAQERQLELRLAKVLDSIRTARRAQRMKDIEAVFDEYGQWVRDTLEVEPVPFVQVLAGVTAPA